jgi:hypothetical protein
VLEFPGVRRQILCRASRYVKTMLRVMLTVSLVRSVTVAVYAQRVGVSADLIK